MIIFGNILGGLSSVFLGLSVHRKTKNEMLKFQIADCICAILSCVILGGFNGAVSNTTALIRNICKVKKWDTKPIVVLIILTTVGIGAYNCFNSERVWYACIPIVATLTYTMSLFIFNDYKKCKLALLMNLILWVIYLLCIKSYISGIVTLIISLNTLVSIIEEPQTTIENNTKRL